MKSLYTYAVSKWCTCRQQLPAMHSSYGSESVSNISAITDADATPSVTPHRVRTSTCHRAAVQPAAKDAVQPHWSSQPGAHHHTNLSMTLLCSSSETASATSDFTYDSDSSYSSSRDDHAVSLLQPAYTPSASQLSTVANPQQRPAAVAQILQGMTACKQAPSDQSAQRPASADWSYQNGRLPNEERASWHGELHLPVADPVALDCTGPEAQPDLAAHQALSHWSTALPSCAGSDSQSDLLAQGQAHRPTACLSSKLTLGIGHSGPDLESAGSSKHSLGNSGCSATRGRDALQPCVLGHLQHSLSGQVQEPPLEYLQQPEEAIPAQVSSVAACSASETLSAQHIRQRYPELFNQHPVAFADTHLLAMPSAESDLSNAACEVSPQEPRVPLPSTPSQSALTASADSPSPIATSAQSVQSITPSRQATTDQSVHPAMVTDWLRLDGSEDLAESSTAPPSGHLGQGTMASDWSGQIQLATGQSGQCSLNLVPQQAATLCGELSLVELMQPGISKPVDSKPSEQHRVHTTSTAVAGQAGVALGQLAQSGAGQPQTAPSSRRVTWQCKTVPRAQLQAGFLRRSFSSSAALEYSPMQSLLLSACTTDATCDHSKTPGTLLLAAVPTPRSDGTSTAVL